ncbi:MarR family transcriptional regulator [bacterium]|nr:MAG: MarR family transcriptional regulator [bacterium]
MLTPNHRQAWIAFFTAQLDLNREIGKAMQTEAGIGMEEYGVLLGLEISENGMMRMGEISDRVSLTPSGVTRLVDRLEKDGLVCRKSCPSDRRALHCVITPAGLAKREEAWEVYRREIENRFASKLDEEEAETVTEVFRRMSDLWKPFA